MTAPLSGITGSVLETRFTAVETGAFFGFARTAILTLGAVVVVPGHAAEEMICFLRGVYGHEHVVCEQVNGLYSVKRVQR
jgi:hypothetical protein